MNSTEIIFDPQLFSIWKKGFLPKDWLALYPTIFDSEDLRLALSQPQYHFAEWFTAIHYFKLGWNALVEQYIYKPHARKLVIIEKYLGKEGVEFLRKSEGRGRIQPPDLFLYRGDEYFFGEIKMPSDKLRDEQKIFFESIEKHFNTSVSIIYLKKRV
ncbi:MAG TPA: hypothetical protein VMR81_02300 [Patescibacteria group bacterium]|nr:hypothetical protein [Patescibacteria group bacterium]